MARKKIIFVIVEGPSDEEALGVILNRFYDRNAIKRELRREISISEIILISFVLAKKFGKCPIVYFICRAIWIMCCMIN